MKTGAHGGVLDQFFNTGENSGAVSGCPYYKG
ncbi:hypothetical protein J2783_001027 [Chryseobacterium sediminis]|nr:hypothetical protein [Chryseobacterium sediminis]